MKTKSNTDKNPQVGLVRQLGLFDSTMVMVGSDFGSCSMSGVPVRKLAATATEAMMLRTILVSLRRVYVPSRRSNRVLSDF